MTLLCTYVDIIIDKISIMCSIANINFYIKLWEKNLKNTTGKTHEAIKLLKTVYIMKVYTCATKLVLKVNSNCMCVQM